MCALVSHNGALKFEVYWNRYNNGCIGNWKKTDSSVHYTVINDRYLCNMCQKTFNSLPILERHVAAKHIQQNEIYFCAKCARYFKTKWSLATHNSRYHKAPGNTSSNSQFTLSSCLNQYSYK